MPTGFSIRQTTCIGNAVWEHMITCRRWVEVLALLLCATPPGAAADECQLVRYGELPVTMVGLRPHISGTINGVAAELLVDSGAWFSMLEPGSLDKYNLEARSVPGGLAITGVTGTAQARLANVSEFALEGFAGGRAIRDVEFLVLNKAILSGEDGLIGQNVIGQNDTEFDLANGVIRLYRTPNCSNRVLAYWHGKSDIAEMDIRKLAPSSPHLISNAKINGKNILVIFDTGATRSILRLKTAKRVGITPEDEGVIAGGTQTNGIGKKSLETWIGRFDALDLGGETIKNAKLLVGEIDLPQNADMLLGIDFFLSHRIYVAADQRKLWFTYNGGPVFDLKMDATLAANSTGQEETQDADDTTSSDLLTDAAAYRRRGAASVSRMQYNDAVADFDRAIASDASDPENYYHRGRALWYSGQADSAMVDFNKALALKSDYIPALVARGALHLQRNDEKRADDDFKAASELAPHDAALQFRIAGYFVSYDYFDVAIEKLTTWINMHPKDSRLPAALNNRCYSRAMANRELDGALVDCNAAMSKRPPDSLVLDSRGLVFLRRGEFDKAIQDYEASLELQPKSAWTRYGLALAKLGNGLTVQGKRELEAAVAMDPTIGEAYGRVGLVPRDD